jgi:hypothetical protein
MDSAKAKNQLENITEKWIYENGYMDIVKTLQKKLQMFLQYTASQTNTNNHASEIVFLKMNPRVQNVEDIKN